MLLRDVTVQSYQICHHVWHRTRYIRAGSEHHSFPDQYGHETPRPVHHRKHSKVSWLRLSTHHLLLWRRPERQTDHQKLSGVSEETAARCAQTRGDWKEIEENDNKWNWLHLCFEFHFQITIVKLVLNQTKKKTTKGHRAKERRSKHTQVSIVHIGVRPRHMCCVDFLSEPVRSRTVTLSKHLTGVLAVRIITVF